MAGLLKYFKCTQKNYMLDTSTLPDPDGPLGRDIPSSSQIPRCIKCNRKHQAKDHMSAIYFADISTKVFYQKNSGRKGHNCNTVLQYSKTLQV